MIRKFKIFGWHIILSREPLRTKPRDPQRNANRSRQRNERLAMVGNHCEVCGQHIDKSCHIHHILPAGVRDRNKVDNIRVICGRCHRVLEKEPHILGYRELKFEHQLATDSAFNRNS